MYFLFTHPGCILFYQDQDNVLSESHDLDFNGRNIFFWEQIDDNSNPVFSLLISLRLTEAN